MRHSELITNYNYSGLNPIQFGHEQCCLSHSYGPAVRTHWLLHYVVSGFGKFTKDNVTHDVNPGQFFVIPPYEVTYYEADSIKPWKYIWIGFSTTEPLPEILSQPVISCPAASSIFNEMLSCNNLSLGKSAFLSGCLWKLMSLLMELSDKKPDYIDQALSFMHTEYTKKISIQEIADLVGLNRSYFYKLFISKTGVSPTQYLINLRLKKAAELMTTYGKQPTVAALSVGYEDFFHFSKLFKKHYGMSPKQYIENLTSSNRTSS